MTTSYVEERLMLGRGWVEAIESGRIYPSLNILISLLSIYGKTFDDLRAIPINSPAIDRKLTAEAVGDDLELRFQYAQYDAEYKLTNATLDQYRAVIRTLREGLGRLYTNRETETIKMESVSDTFLNAIKTWPSTNPSDLWWFLIYRAYCDPYNQIGRAHV